MEPAEGVPTAPGRRQARDLHVGRARGTPLSVKIRVCGRLRREGGRGRNACRPHAAGAPWPRGPPESRGPEAGLTVRAGASAAACPGLLPSARAALQSPRPSPPDRLVERPSAAFPCDRGVPGRRTAGPRGGRTRCRPRVPLNPRTWATALAGFLAAALTKKRAMATEQRQLRSTLRGAPSVSASPPESDMRLLVTLWATAGPPCPSRVSAEPPRCPPPPGFLWR